MVTVEIVINSTGVMGVSVTISCRYRIAFEVMLLFLVFFNGRMPRSGKLPVLNLLTGQKIRFFAPHGRLVAPIQVKLGMTDGHVGPLGCAKFRLNRQRGVGMRLPKYQKFPLFGKESPRKGDSLD